MTRIVITGIGLTSPIGNNLGALRDHLLHSTSGIIHRDIRHMGQVAMGLCNYDENAYQTKKAARRGTRAGALSIYATHEALKKAQLNLKEYKNLHRVGVYLGITEHGNVETEEEIHQLYQNDGNINLWSHHHNPRTVANAPAGEVTLNLGITGPHYTIGGACAAGNLGPITGYQMLLLGDVDIALAGGVSESSQCFGIFAAFKAQGALGHHTDPTLACLPLDKDRNGIVVSEGACVYVLERLEDVKRQGRDHTILGEIIGYGINSDASDYVLPNVERQKECMLMALEKAKIHAHQVDCVSMHATGTQQGDLLECQAIRSVFENTHAFINGSKGHLGHCMGAAGAIELAGNIPSFWDNMVHPLRLQNLDPECALKNLVIREPRPKKVDIIVNNSFGMLGINSTLIIKKYT